MLLAALASSPTSAAECGSPADRAVRDWLQAVFEARAQGSIPPLSAAQWEKVRETAKSLRISSAGARLPLARAPYFSALLYSQYPKVYADQLAQKVYEYTHPIPLEPLLDEVLRQVREFQALSLPSQIAFRLAGGENSEIASASDKLGPCLANNAAAGQNCGLDPSDAENVPSLGTLVTTRATCTEGSWLDSWTKCDYRRFVYNAAKPDLKALRPRPSVIEKVTQKVRTQFAEEFPLRIVGDDGRQQQRNFHGLVPAKWGVPGVGSTLWSTQADLLTGGATGVVCLGELAQSLELDVALARAARETHSDEKSLADGAAFLYSAVNRFFWLNGGTELSLHPGASIVLGSAPATHNLFGGIGMGPAGYGAWIFDPAVNGAYDPTGTLTGSATPMRIFPEKFTVGARGEILASLSAAPGAQSESLTDLARLLRASVSYLRATRANTAERGPLAPYFGAEADLAAGLLNAASPLIFPATQGRGAALGVLSGIVQNLTLPDRGHVQMLDLADPDSGSDLPGPNLGLYAHDRVRLGGRELAPMQSESVIALLGAASALVSDLSSAGGAQDEIYPVAMRKASAQLNVAIGLLALNLVGLGQREDGAFKTRLTLDASEGVRISTTLRALDALSRVPDPSMVLPWKEAVRAGFKFIEANRTQIDAMASVDPSLPLLAVMAWDRVTARLPLGTEQPLLRDWIQSKRAW